MNYGEVVDFITPVRVVICGASKDRLVTLNWDWTDGFCNVLHSARLRAFWIICILFYQ